MPTVGVQGLFRILVTGFEPFGGEVKNPTADLMAALSGGEIAIPETVEVRSLVLPVEFKRAFEILEAQRTQFQPNAILAFGQAGGRSRIEFERFAINVMEAEIPDNAGFKPAGESVVAGGPLAYASTLPIHDLQNRLSENGLPTGLSNSAGLYVCNDLFYRLQHRLLSQPEVRSGFIHVPYLPEQAAQRGAPSLEFSEMKRALELVLLAISKIPFSHT